MAKKKKNNHYVTEKTVAAKVAKEEETLKLKKQKMIKTIAIYSAAVVAVIGVLFGVLFAAGAFDYQPEGTYDVVIEIEDYGSLHVELYGNDAPETVDHFRDLVNKGYYNGKTIFKLFDDLAYAGDTNAANADKGIKGEFSDNGVKNKVSHTRGVISMARGDDPNSAYGQFFIVTKDSPELDGKYAAFACITDGMDIIDKILEDIEVGENGMIEPGKEPKITRISGHESHGH